MWSEIFGMFEYLYKVDWVAETSEELFAKYGKENFLMVLEAYEQDVAMVDDREQWFSDLKIIAEKVGYEGDNE